MAPVEVTTQDAEGEEEKVLSIDEERAQAGLKLFEAEDTAMAMLNVTGATEHKDKIEAQIKKMEEEIATLIGKENKKLRTELSKEVSNIKNQPQYIDACKVVKGLDPKNGFFAKAPEAALGEENENPDANQPEGTKMRLRAPGLTSFDLDLQPGLTVAELKHLAKEKCGIKPSCMRITMGGQVLKDTDVIEGNGVFDGGKGIQVTFQTGSEYLLGGADKNYGLGRNVRSKQPKTVQQGCSGRGIPGSKGLRCSRISGRFGGMGLIRKYGLLMKRQEFREKAGEMGWVKYR